MSNETKKAATDVAALQKKYDTAAKKVANLSDDEKPEEVQKAAEEVAELLDALNQAKESVFVKVKFLKTPTGRFNLAYTKGDTGEVSLLMAEVMENEGYCAVKDIEVTAETVTE